MIILSIVSSCSNENVPDLSEENNEDKDKFAINYSVGNYLNKYQVDTLLVDLITYIGRKHVTADYKTRFLPQYRQYYTDMLGDYSIAYYYIDADSLHYYYVVRPARTTSGNKRGVGGMFRFNEELGISNFEETFNTPVSNADKIVEKGVVLFRELIENKNVDALLNDSSLVEWPDHRLKYDKERYEWRYVSDL